MPQLFFVFELLKESLQLKTETSLFFTNLLSALRVLLSWLSWFTEDSFQSLVEPGSGSGCSSFSASSSSSSSSSQVDGWLWRGGRLSLVGHDFPSWRSSGSELSWELAGLRLPDESNRLLSGGLQKNEIVAAVRIMGQFGKIK